MTSLSSFIYRLSLCLLPVSAINAQSSYVDMHVTSCPQDPDKDRNIWSLREYSCPITGNPLFMKTMEEVPKKTQANLEEMLKGNVRISNQVLTMLEGQIIKSKGFNSDEGVTLLSCLTGVNFSKLDLARDDINYFDGILKQIRYIKREQSETHYAGSRAIHLEIIKSPAQADQILNDPSKIGMAISLKGGHLLSAYLPVFTGLSNTPEFEKMVLTNVDRLKGRTPLVDNTNEYLDFPIFSISFDSYFDDAFCGRSRVFNDAEEKIFGKQPNIDGEITPLGQKVIKQLVANYQGHRILVDVSDMSYNARKWYFDYVKTQRENGDTIPLLASHSGVNGMNIDQPEFTANDVQDKSAKSWFNISKRSLCRQDINGIFESNGLFGIPMDKRQIINGTLFEKEMQKTLPGSSQRKELYIKAVVANICKIVHTVQDASVWDMISISSEFGQFSHPFDSYATASELSDFARDLRKYLQNPTDIYDLYSADQVRGFLYDIPAETIVDKIMTQNALNFMKRNIASTGGDNNGTANNKGK